MRASDGSLHQQITHFAVSCRKALASDAVVVITRFWDDELESEATAFSFDIAGDKKDQEKASDALHIFLSGIATLLAGTPMQLWLKHRDTGVEVPFYVDNPHHVEVDFDE